VPATKEVAVRRSANNSGPAHELEEGLIDALVRIPIFTTSSNRRLLISLIKRDTSHFPEIEERHETRLHVVAIVLICLEQPARLRALQAALKLMAPDDAGTVRACELIDSATLLDLLPGPEIQRARDLLSQAADRPEFIQWQQFVAELVPEEPAVAADDLVDAFDFLLDRDLSQDFPPALMLVAQAARAFDHPVATGLQSWLDERIAQMSLTDSFILSMRPNDVPTYTQPSNDIDSISILHESSIMDPSASMIADAVREVEGIPVDSDGDEGDHTSANITANLNPGDEMPPVITVTKLPGVWGDVPPRNPNFTGREALLERLHNELLGHRAAAVLPQAVYGMGGVGKSQLVNEYVHQHRSELDLIWWIPAENESQILTSLTRLAQRLDLDVSPEANNAVPAVREALSTGKVPFANWLLVFDNAESVEDVRSYFPTGGAGKILVTSRNPGWARAAQALEVDVFTRDESKKFLTARNPELAPEDANRLAEALGDLPLAVEQAAAWRAETGMSVDEYLELLDDKRLELLSSTTSPDYPTSVAAAWNISLDELDATNPAALQLLQVCSYLSPDPISRKLFSGFAIAPLGEGLDEALSDAFQLGRAIQDIKRFSLARLDPRTDTLQIHRLVQKVLKARMNDHEHDLMSGSAHALLATANPHQPSSRDSWDRYQALLPHVIASRVVESDDQDVQRLAFETVEFLYYWGDHKGCIEFADELYRQRRRLFGESSEQALSLAKYLGYIKCVMGDFTSATKLFEDALRLYLASLGEEHEETLDAMRMVGFGYQASGDFEKAKQIHMRGYETCLRVLPSGPDHRVSLETANSLGVSLRLTGEFADAVRRDEETHQRFANVIGPDDVNSLWSYDNYNASLREAGKYLVARRQQELVYDRFTAAFGDDKPYVLRAARNLAVARRRAGEHAGALSLAAETAEKFRRRYGDVHPDTLAACLSLAIEMRHARELSAARQLGEMTLARYREMCGETHPFTLSARTNLAVVLRLQNDPATACDMNERTYGQLRDKLGDDHPVTLCCAANLASDQFALGKLENAFDLDTDTLAKSERILGVEHPSTLAVGVNLALDLRARGRAQEAVRLHSDTMERFRRSLGEQHPATLNAHKSLRADCDVDIVPI
jgi:tetratricopeptide (TPR) repeat protein